MLMSNTVFAARLLRSWVRIPLGAWMFVCCECCVLSGRGLCEGLITSPEESYRLWRVVVCDQETSHARRLYPTRKLQNTNPQWVVAPVQKKTNRPSDVNVQYSLRVMKNRYHEILNKKANLTVQAFIPLNPS